MPGASLWAASYERRVYLLGLWQDRARAAYHHWVSAISGLVCIHGGEGAWNANTGNGYYGGLQMDLSFQAHWGSWLLNTKGTADHWTASEQLRVGLRAVRSIGYGPWPNTARACGLL